MIIDWGFFDDDPRRTLFDTLIGNSVLDPLDMDYNA